MKIGTNMKALFSVKNGPHEKGGRSENWTKGTSGPNPNGRPGAPEGTAKVPFWTWE